MTFKVQFKYGTTAQNNAYTGGNPEITIDSTKHTLRIHDGQTLGGTELARILDLAPFQLASEKGVANGLATLDATGKVPTSQLPSAIMGAMTYQGTWNASTNLPAIPTASNSNKGYYYVVSTDGTTTINGESDWKAGDWIVSNGVSWGKVDNTDKVASVAGKVGAVTLAKADVDLANVDNTSDANKPVSTAQQTALDSKLAKSNNFSDVLDKALCRTNLGLIIGSDVQPYNANIQAHINITSGNPHGITPALISAVPTSEKGVANGVATLDVNGKVPASQTGLGNVDNTSDLNKPISTATQTALNAKIDSSQKGANNGVATLDGGGKVPASQLPSYVDDVVESNTYASLPGTGETGKIYVVLADENRSGATTQYRWTGSAYTIITASPGTSDAVPEGSSNLYFTYARVRATILTGLSVATNTVITAANSVVEALGMLQAQISAHIARSDNPHGTTAAQTGAIPSTEKGAANGVASLGSDGKVPTAQLPTSGATGGATGGGTDKVFLENDQTVSNDYTITAGKNAGTFGPVSIANGKSVTIPNGSVWTIV